jgi:hypothetical protein
MQANRVSQFWIALAVFAAGVLYLAALPRPLNPADEAVHLYAAKRILVGDVMYRDIFEIITPGYMYVMAALFWIFGTDITTARLAMAVLHGATMVLIGCTALRVQVRPALAWAVAFSYLALCQSAWPIASQHWLSTLLYVAVLFVLAAEARTSRRLVLAGVLLGCLIGVQQQRGVILTVGVALWVVIDTWLSREPAGAAARGWGTIGARVPALVIGVAAVVGPLLVVMIATAGIAPVWRALVIHPIVNYGGRANAPWGYVGLLTLEYARATFVPVLVWLPAVLGLTLARWLAGIARGQVTPALRRLGLLVVLGAFSILSIAYFPDFIHIAFIAPVILIAAAENGEWLLHMLARPIAIGRAVGIVIAAAITLVCAQKLRSNLSLLRQAYPLVHQTAFGRVAMQTPRDVELYDQIDTLLDGTPARALYSYPVVAHWYLLANATNPTRYGFFLASYNGPEQTREVLDVLAAKRLPYIVSLPPTVIKDDPILAYIAREYEPVSAQAPPGYQVYRRKADS